MKNITLILLSCLGAVLLPLALPNDLFAYGAPLVGLVCLVPFFYAICRSPSYRFSLLLGAVFGAVSTFLSYYWLIFFEEFAVWTIGGVTFAYILFNSILALVLRFFARKFPRQRIFVLAMIWTAYEYLKSCGFLAFPWGLMAHPFHDILPLIQVADLCGVWGVSFLAILINTFFCETLLSWPVFPLPGKKFPLNKTWLTQGLVVAGLLCISLIYGFIRLGLPLPVEKEFTSLLVQQNMNSWEQDDRNQAVLQAVQLTEEGYLKAEEKPDLIIWSETALSQLVIRSHYYQQQPAEKPFLPFVKELETHFLVGAPAALIDPQTGRPRGYMNSTVLISPRGTPLELYGKQHPVPFAEKLPLFDYEPVRRFYKNAIGLTGQWLTGNEQTVFSMPLAGRDPLLFSTPICFEDAFPDLNRRFIRAGAELWINLTNVSWSRRESAEIQMFVAAKFRCVENRRVMIRSTNAGVTSVIDPWGHTLEKLPLFSPETLFTRVPVYKPGGFTLYTMAGDFLPLLFILILLAGLGLRISGLWPRVKKPRGRNQ